LRSYLRLIFTQKYIVGWRGFLFLDQAGCMSDKMASLLDELVFECQSNGLEKALKSNFVYTKRSCIFAEIL
jgi:hypothetical protein